MEAKQIKDLMEAYASVYTQSEEVVVEENLEEKKIATGTGKKVMPSAEERSKLAKRARAGEDIGKKGKGFEAVAAKAAKQYGSKEAGERVAAAAMFKQQAKEEFELDEDAKYDRNRKRAAQRAAARNEARKQGKTGVVPGVGYVSPRPERETYTDSAGVQRHKTGARMPQKEEVDLFDYILEHLVAEGYADTNKAALAIMANMSEEWKQDIIEGMTMDDFKKQRRRQKEEPPIRKRGGLSAPEGERSIGGQPNRDNKDYWASVVGKNRDRGAGNKAKRRAAEMG